MPNPHDQITAAVTMILDAVGSTADRTTTVTVEAGVPMLVTLLTVDPAERPRRHHESTAQIHRSFTEAQDFEVRGDLVVPYLTAERDGDRVDLQVGRGFKSLTADQARDLGIWLLTGAAS